jgi:outer membrane protein assembly factor BamA
LAVQAFVTTTGLQQHFIDYDAPYLADSPFRLRATIGYERNTSASYFGRGAATLQPLSYPGATRSYATIREYISALRQIGPDGVTHTLYNKYDLEAPGVRASLERVSLQGLIRLQAGLGFSYVRIRDYSGAPTSGDDPAHGKSDVHATQSSTRLREDCQSGLLVGCAGGLHNTLKLGVALDTRDYEPDPNSGMFIDLTGEFSSRMLGSAFDYARMTFAARGFLSLFPGITDLVVAARAVYSMQTAGTPFFAMSTLAFTDMDRQGLGGLWSLRGYRQERFVGPVAALANLELRWTFVAFDLLSQHIALAVVPFLDVGRVFDRVDDASFKLWKLGSGGALQVGATTHTGHGRQQLQERIQTLRRQLAALRAVRGRSRRRRAPVLNGLRRFVSSRRGRFARTPAGRSSSSH